MNKVKEILNRMFNRLVKWKVHMIATLAMVIVTVLGVLDFCNYIGQDKLITLHCLILFLTITAICLFWWWWIDEESFKWMVIVVMIIIAILGAWDAYHCKCFVGDGKPITLDYLVGFLLTMATIYLFWRRAKNQEEQIKIEDFNAAVNLLGSEQTSARTGAIYSLYRQAVEHKKYREQIVQILCSHIRSKTQESDYQKEYKKRPSNEVQMTINLLFRGTQKRNEGLYPRFRQVLPNANLSYAYCVGADFVRSYCEGTDFRGTHCEGADFREAHCEGADFRETHCEEANFWGAHCEGANFLKTFCQGARFLGAHCQETNFRETHCEGAIFWKAHCEGAGFTDASCQGADFRGAHCEGAYSFYQVQFLEDRIDENTELEEVLVAGALSDQSINTIEKSKEYCSPEWYSKMKRIIEKNEDKQQTRSAPKDIISGKLEDSEELQKIIKLLKEIIKRNIF